MGKTFKIFGLVFFVMGMIIIFNSFQGITGFAISEKVDINAGFIVGAWFILTGILLFVYVKEPDRSSSLSIQTSRIFQSRILDGIQSLKDFDESQAKTKGLFDKKAEDKSKKKQ